MLIANSKILKSEQKSGMIFLLKFFLEKQNQYSCTFCVMIFSYIMDELFISLF